MSLTFKDLEEWYLSELIKKFGEGTPEHRLPLLKDILKNVNEKLTKKYAQGAKEHSDDLSYSVALKELELEAIDLLVYSFVIGKGV